MRTRLAETLRTYSRHWLFQSGVAVVLFGATLALSWLLNWTGLRINLTVPIVVSIVAAAWYGGRTGGVIISVLFQGATLLLSPVPADQPPLYRWTLHISVFLLYLFLVFVISGLKNLSERLRQHRDLDRKAHV